MSAKGSYRQLAKIIIFLPIYANLCQHSEATCANLLSAFYAKTGANIQLCQFSKNCYVMCINSLKGQCHENFVLTETVGF